MSQSVSATMFVHVGKDAKVSVSQSSHSSGSQIITVRGSRVSLDIFMEEEDLVRLCSAIVDRITEICDQRDLMAAALSRGGETRRDPNEAWSEFAHQDLPPEADPRKVRYIEDTDCGG